MYTFDHPLFLALNFDGGPFVDSLMNAISGTYMWIPLYLFILWTIWKRWGWKGVVLFIITLAAAMGLSDLICGIFKHSGPLKHLWESFPARLRPMWTPELQGLLHNPPHPHTPGQYGTVSAHAATMAALSVVSSCWINRRWFTIVMVTVTVLICYSRIYLAMHFPVDLMLGLLTGTVCAALLTSLSDMAQKKLGINEKQ